MSTVYLVEKGLNNVHGEPVEKLLMGKGRSNGKIDVKLGLAICTKGHEKPDLSENEIWVYKDSALVAKYKICETDYDEKTAQWEIDLGQIEAK